VTVVNWNRGMARRAAVNEAVKAKFFADPESKHRSIANSMEIYKRSESSICRWRSEAGWATQGLSTEFIDNQLRMLADPGFGKEGEHPEVTAVALAKKHNVSVQTVYRARRRLKVLRYKRPPMPEHIRIARRREQTKAAWARRRPSFNKNQRWAMKYMNAWHQQVLPKGMTEHLESLRE